MHWTICGRAGTYLAKALRNYSKWNVKETEMWIKKVHEMSPWLCKCHTKALLARESWNYECLITCICMCMHTVWVTFMCVYTWACVPASCRRLSSICYWSFCYSFYHWYWNLVQRIPAVVKVGTILSLAAPGAVVKTVSCAAVEAYRLIRTGYHHRAPVWSFFKIPFPVLKRL